MGSAAGVRKLANVVVPVRDQEAALAFYTQVLGLTVRVDIAMGDYRWVEVGPEGTETSIALPPPGPDGQAGGRQTGISLLVGDVDAAHAHLRAAGADVDAAVLRVGGPVPPMVWLRDPEGNVLLLVQDLSG